MTLSDNRLGGDVLTLSHTAADFTDKNVAAGKTINVSGLSATGADAGNYSLTMQSPQAATITAKPVTSSGLSVAASKVYDGSTGATAVTTGATFTGAVPGDNLTVTVASASGRELSLTYKGGEKRLVVPPGTPVVTLEPGDASLLKAGNHVFLGATQAADEHSASRVQAPPSGVPGFSTQAPSLHE